MIPESEMTALIRGAEMIFRSRRMARSCPWFFRVRSWKRRPASAVSRKLTAAPPNRSWSRRAFFRSFPVIGEVLLTGQKIWRCLPSCPTAS